MMKLKIAVLLFSTYSLSVFAQDLPVNMQTLHLAGKEINYYLIQKQAEKSKDLLVLLQGSDCKSVINNPNMLKNFGVVFPDNDILLVEKTGLNSHVGTKDEEASEEECPVDYMSKDSPLERANNYIVVLKQLKNDYQHIVLLGGSEGALVTNLIVAQENFITASVALNVGGQYFINDVLYSIENNTPKEEVANSKEGFEQFAEAIKQKQLNNDQFVSGHGSKWWYEMLTIDNLKLIQSVKTPHLVIQTMADTNVDAHGTDNMMQQIRNPHVSYRAYQDLDHFFKDKNGQLQTEQIVTDIQHWYQTVTK
ncbi:alpha/beta hydrolase family protein [Providencia huaxiensis]|uniref:alpha/beta hydrolase family protein n=1 Tax=Providencia huaxiensis TaxID=2027290 RepID=UPI001EFE85BE|nr:alpha/beta hydrolase [Providencia huaxiensis]MCG9534977.1 alpha/beta hydrolase [Providencia huaxiensis]